MDIWLQLAVVRDHLRLVLIVTLASGLAAFALTRLLPTEYQAEARLLVGDIVLAEDPEINEVALAERLSRTYAELVTTRPVLEAVLVELGLEGSADDLVGRVAARADLDSPYISIDVRDGSPELAAAIANAFAAEIIALAPTTSSGGGREKLSLINVVEPAVVPSSPISPRVNLILILGLVAGVGVGLASAFLIEFLYPRLRAPRSIAAATGWPTLAAAPPGSVDDGTPGRMDGEDRAPFATLLTNLLAAQPTTGPRVVLVTAATAGAGATRTAIGLALAAAAAGLTALAIDGDSQRAGLTSAFGAVRSPGLPALITGTSERPKAVIQSTPYPRIGLIPAGTPDASGSIGLNALQLSRLLATLRETYDLIIIDAPPVLTEIRTAQLALAADGVVLVVDVTSARRADVDAARIALDRIGAPIAGTVANRYRFDRWLTDHATAPALAPALDRVADARDARFQPPG